MTGSSRSGTVIEVGGEPLADGHGNLWGITPSGLVEVNGVPDRTTANVVRLGFENGQVWQENSASLWWGKTTPGDAWFPPEGTPVSPFDAAPMDPRIALLLQSVSELKMQVSQAFGLIMSDIRRIPADINQATTVLTKEISTMSATVTSQMDADNVALTAALDRLTTAAGTIGADVTNLEAELATALAGLPVGTQVTQAQLDTFTAAIARAGAISDSLEAIAATVPPATPAPTPVPTPAPTPDPNAPPAGP